MSTPDSVKRRKTITLVVVVIGLVALVLAGPYIFIAVGFTWMFNHQIPDHQRRVLYHTDHRALLAACRDIIREKKPRLTKKEPNVAVSNSDPSLPPIIRSLNPSWIMVDDASIFIELGGGYFHYEVIAYAEDAHAREVQDDHLKMLILGLWYDSEDRKVIPP
jgi:hypothetical protein